MTPLLIGDPSRLSAKLTGATGLLGEYWSDFRETFLADPKTRAEMIFLPAVLGIEGLDEARENLRGYWRRLANEDSEFDVQLHTWCRCGSVLRRILFFDWTACAGGWSAEEIDEAAESFLGFTFKHAYMTLVGRTRVSNNQALSMALCCTLAGLVFGRRHGPHATAKFLFEYGMGRLPDLIGLFPQDGYGGEGSTYTSHVNTPLSYWTAALLNEITGKDWWETPFAPNGTTLRRMTEMELKITSPGGLLAPWDHYGWQNSVNASPYAFLAAVESNPRYLSLIPALDVWKGAGMLAWGADDPLWTLIWWPEQFKDYDDRDLPDELFGWFLPRTGAALDDCKRRARLMQVWDASGPSIANVGRAHVNPNHLMFDYDGQPVFLDGVAVSGSDPWQYPAEKVLTTLGPRERERFETYAYSSGSGNTSLLKLIAGISAGLIGCSNAIIVDGEGWYWPGEARIGAPIHYSGDKALQTVTADSAAFYRPKYDVHRAIRTSAWSEDGFGIVHDVIEAASSHSWTWQVHLPPTAERVGENSVRIPVSGGKTVLLAWAPVETVQLTQMESFPASFMDGEPVGSRRLELSASGSRAECWVLIAPETANASIRPSGQDRADIVIDGARRTIELPSEPNVGAVGHDIHELPDILTDRDTQFAAFDDDVKWESQPYRSALAGLAGTDYCFAQLGVAGPDEAALLGSLQGAAWPVKIAAAEAIGRLGLTGAAPELRSALEAEHARPTEEVYPPDFPPGEEPSCRWRLKTALIVALGRLKDRDAVPLLGRILADARDFYCVYSAAAQALGRIGGPGALDALQPALLESEDNTRRRAHAAAAALRS